MQSLGADHCQEAHTTGDPDEDPAPRTTCSPESSFQVCARQVETMALPQHEPNTVSHLKDTEEEKGKLLFCMCSDPWAVRGLGPTGQPSGSPEVEVRFRDVV